MKHATLSPRRSDTAVARLLTSFDTALDTVKHHHCPCRLYIYGKELAARQHIRCHTAAIAATKRSCSRIFEFHYPSQGEVVGLSIAAGGAVGFLAGSQRSRFLVGPR